ncbi:hypothetical protein AAP_02215 [Ascosphaera apis ARSEF 7405]|uniref:Major facilitator superfamily domain, general substrate transporter n=1 Tax=Ascosphaera apis ARSEF 7405 TaxID=392613 RepID=A0A168AMY2_9EURO|nr:hypothetical protein AAP_02215 [Ascosphaera apis ARSEF 7405]
MFEATILPKSVLTYCLAEPIEKHAVEEGITDDAAPILTSTTERKLMLKVDAHILPPLVVLYLLAFLDRVNISNAAVFKLKQDLHIESGTKYNTALTIFFVPYIIAEVCIAKFPEIAGYDGGNP